MNKSENKDAIAKATTDTTKDKITNKPAPGELSEQELEKAAGGAIDAYLYFKPGGHG